MLASSRRRFLECVLQTGAFASCISLHIWTFDLSWACQIGMPMQCPPSLSREQLLGPIPVCHLFLYCGEAFLFKSHSRDDWQPSVASLNQICKVIAHQSNFSPITTVAVNLLESVCSTYSLLFTLLLSLVISTVSLNPANQAMRLTREHSLREAFMWFEKKAVSFHQLHLPPSLLQTGILGIQPQQPLCNWYEQQSSIIMGHVRDKVVLVVHIKLRSRP